MEREKSALFSWWGLSLIPFNNHTKWICVDLAPDRAG